MAYCSQHPMQIMENQTRFDLENALRAWREDCASRAGISFEDARELESDLRERVADLCKQGLSENEAFREAVQQVGPPSVLAQEFARENPLAVWRERLLWMVAAGFAVAVWRLTASFAILWFFQTFWELLPVSVPVGPFASFTESLVILAAAVMLATGRLDKLAGHLQCIVRTRQRLAIAGLGLLAVGVTARLFIPHPISLPGSAGFALLVVLVNFAGWPLLLLALGVFLFRPVPASDLGSLQLRLAATPAAVWRERVCWMAIGGLMVGFWKTVSWLCIKALFYTGDIHAPFNFEGRLFLPIYLLIHFSPVLVLSLLLRQRMRNGKSITGAALVRSPVLYAGVPAFVCAWTCLYLWSEYHWMPRESGVSFSALVSNFLFTFRWVWPVGLTALLLWLMPEVSKRQSSEFAE